MDCEKFESAMMDELYGELDELTSAAAKRHVAGCARCAALIGGLRATRRVATLPMVEPPAGLEERILAAAREAQKVVPIRSGLARAVSLAGTWAMRPQTAMAALFLVMIGTSVLLIRGKPSRAPSAEVTVTEQGAPAVAAPTATTLATSEQPAASVAVVMRAPEPKAAFATPPAIAFDESHASRAVAAPPSMKERDDDSFGGAAAPPAVAAAPSAAPAGGDLRGGASGALSQAQAGAQTEEAQKKTAQLGAFDTALQSFRAGRFDDATRGFDGLAPSDANADLWAARAVREGKGCRNALARFDKVARRAAGSAPGWDALLEGALCYRSVGDFGQARVRLTELLKVDSHRDRAQAELDRLNQLQQSNGSIAHPAAGAAMPAPAPRAPKAATQVDQGY